MDDTSIEAEAREYVERAARTARRDRGSIPRDAFERAVKTAARSTKELHAAVKLAQEAGKRAK
jgi:hypothetical protein